MTITQLDTIKIYWQCFFRGCMYDSYPCVCVISAASMFIICLLVASFRDLVFAYSCMMCSPPGLVVSIFSINLNGNKIYSQKCLNHTYNGEIITEKHSPSNWAKSRFNLTMSTTHLFCLIVYVAWPFRLTSFGSGCFFRRITHCEVQNNSIFRCCWTWWWWCQRSICALMNMNKTETY